MPCRCSKLTISGICPINCQRSALEAGLRTKRSPGNVGKNINAVKVRYSDLLR